MEKTRGHGIKEPVIGLLPQGRESHLHLYNMADDHDTGSNYIIDGVHRLLCEKSRELQLPKGLFIQFENFHRENKK